MSERARRQGIRVGWWGTALGLWASLLGCGGHDGARPVAPPPGPGTAAAVRSSTPSAGSGALPGVMRSLVLEVAAELDVEVRKETCTLPTFLEADEVFVTNALVGVLPIRWVAHGTFLAPGPVTARVCKALAPHLRA